jgi:hypothetical protein
VNFINKLHYFIDSIVISSQNNIILLGVTWKYLCYREVNNCLCTDFLYTEDLSVWISWWLESYLVKVLNPRWGTWGKERKGDTDGIESKDGICKGGITIYWGFSLGFYYIYVIILRCFVKDILFWLGLFDSFPIKF